MAFPAKNYTYGRYKVWFDPFLAGTKTTTGQRYFGNTPELSLTSDSEDLDHYDSDEGIRVKDDSMLLELTRSGAFTTDHISPENLAAFFLGSSSVLAQTAQTAQSYAVADVIPGRRYQIGAGPTARAGVRGLASATVAAAAGGTTYVAGTDYVVDLSTGGLSIVSGGAITDGTDLTVTYATTATSYNRVVSADSSQLYGAMFLESRNPKGELMDYYFPYVSVKPDGDFALKGDEWQVLSFSFEVLKLDSTTPSVIITGRPNSGI